jgi:hypothetical protein
MITIVYFIFFKKFGPVASTPTSDTSGTMTQTEQPKITETDIEARDLKIPEVKRSRETISQDALKRMAGLFAERFGSFSTQSTYQNMIDLELFMTERMVVWAEKYVDEKVSNTQDSKIYYGVTTRAVTTAIDKYDDTAGLATIKVGTYRTESTGMLANSSTFNQDLVITYKKERGAWKVDEARWADKKVR